MLFRTGRNNGRERKATGNDRHCDWAQPSRRLPARAMTKRSATLARCTQSGAPAGHTDRSTLVGRSGLFRRLSDEAREALLARGRIKEYAANDVIFLAGQHGESILAILRGSIRISVPTVDGKDIVLAILGPGEICGEVALLDRAERTADARAAIDCTVVAIDRRDALALLGQHPDGWTILIEMLCQRLSSADQQIAEFALAPVSVRLAKALLRLATSDGQTADGAARECIHLSQLELANVIGTTRETVNKYLRRWQRQGCLQIGDRRIVVTNRPAVEKLARAAPETRAR
jgi:CRP/FNR family transcriptional regulator, cyclic AMP receptor protein